MKRCVIHFGMHKTGTSSIQHSFHQQLDTPQWKYLDLGRVNHSGPLSMLLEDNPRHRQKRGLGADTLPERKDWYKNLLLAQMDSDAENVLISGESLCSSAIGVEQLQVLRDLLASRVDQISVVGYVRSPKAYMESAFQEKTKRGFLELDFRKSCMYPNYRQQLTKFYKVFGKKNVELWKFEPRSFPEGCVVQDFCARLGIAFPVESIKRVNDGLTFEALAFLYTYQKYGLLYAEDVVDFDRRGDLLITEQLAKLKGNKVRFDWEAIAPGLEKRQKDIHWVEEQLGESFEEPHHNEYPVIREEADLLSYRLQDLQWLLEQLGPEYENRRYAQVTYREVAEWMNELRTQLLKQYRKSKRSEMDAQTS